MAERYQYGRNLPDGTPDKEYDEYFGTITGDEDAILNIFYHQVIRHWVHVSLSELGPDEIHDELTELLKINHVKLTEMKVGDQVDFKVLDHKHWLRVIEVQD